MGSQGGEDQRQGSKQVGDWVGEAVPDRRDFPHSRADKLGGTTGERDRLHNPGCQRREIKPQNLWR